MPIPTAVKYGREACFSLSVANSQPPTVSSLGSHNRAVSGTTVTFHYYTQDYLGNNRAVINGSTGAIEQTVAYYPYGAVIADLGTPTTGQPYKFGGKELITTNGLNEYDFGARQYYSAVPAFTRIDPMVEKYPWLSPYLYCANNPVNLTDPTGKVISMPSDSSVVHMVSVMVNIQKITNDELFLSRQDDGNITIKISNFKDGDKKNGTRLIRRLNGSDKTVTIKVVSEGVNSEQSTSSIDSRNGVGTNAIVTFNLNAILYRLKTGGQLKFLSVEELFSEKVLTYGAVFHHYNRGRKAGEWKAMWLTLLDRHRHEFDMSSENLDGSHTAAMRGGEECGSTHKGISLKGLKHG